MTNIPRVKAGDSLSAKLYNMLVDGVNRKSLLGGQGQVIQSIDEAVNAPAGITLELFEITGHLEIKTTSGVSDGVYSCPVRSVTYLHKNDPENPNQYRGYEHTNPSALEVRLYFPTGITYPRLGTIANHPILAPPMGYRLAVETEASPRSDEANPMVWGTLNPTSGRWEYVGPSETILRFESKTTKTTDDEGPEEVYVLSYNRQSEIWERQTAVAGGDGTTVVYDPMTKFAWSGDGARGYAKLMGDSGRFEIINAESTSAEDQMGWGFIAQPSEAAFTTDETNVEFTNIVVDGDGIITPVLGSGGVAAKALKVNRTGIYLIGYHMTGQHETTGTDRFILSVSGSCPQNAGPLVDGVTEDACSAVGPSSKDLFFMHQTNFSIRNDLGGNVTDEQQMTIWGMCEKKVQGKAGETFPYDTTSGRAFSVWYDGMDGSPNTMDGYLWIVGPLRQ